MARARPSPEVRPAGRGPGALAAAALVALAACAGPVAHGAKPEAMRHPEKRFLVDYGGEVFRVNVRYVDIISESVFAVRRGRDGAKAGWTEIALEPGVTPPAAEPFASEAWRPVAVDIADRLAGTPPICAEGQTMRLALGEDRGARALYRSPRQAWVVFAFCPPAEGA
jgi:hypothetical protein